MVIATYQGTVEKGQVKLPANIRLPEKAKVFVIVPESPDNRPVKKFDLAELVAQMPPDYEASEEEW